MSYQLYYYEPTQTLTVVEDGNSTDLTLHRLARGIAELSAKRDSFFLFYCFILEGSGEEKDPIYYYRPIGLNGWCWGRSGSELIVDPTASKEALTFLDDFGLLLDIYTAKQFPEPRQLANVQPDSYWYWLHHNGFTGIDMPSLSDRLASLQE